MKTIFYDTEENKEIIDISGKKTIDDIKKEFGNKNYQTLSVTDNEPYRIENGLLKKFSKKELDIKNAEKMREAKIQAKMKELLRKQAISELEAEGEI